LGATANAQSEIPVKALQMKIGLLQASYDSIFTPETELFNGKAFYPEGDSVNHPYFGQNGWKQGEIYYMDRVFRSAYLRYNICSDRLIGIFFRGESSYPLFLNRETVLEFVYNTHHFRFLQDTVPVRRKILKPGYYEILYEGKVCLYLKWMKSKENDRSTLQTIYPESVLFIIKKNGKMQNIRTSGEFFAALGDHEKELKAFLRENNIQFRRKEFASFGKVLEYYDSL
jgi:hypothetical protein